MPIREIIDGFKLNRSVPVDDRIVASDPTTRNNITYKYNGLRVFDLSDQTPYVWINNAWKKEGENYLIGTSLKTNYLVKFNDINKGLTNSSIIDNGGCVFINHLTLPTIDSTIKLDVNGVLKASSFTGIGTNVTNLNASEINSGQLDYSLIAPPSTTPTQILVTKIFNNNLVVDWGSLSSISTFSVDFKTIIYDDDSKFYILYTDGSKLYKTGDTESKILKYSPISGQILMKSDKDKPSYSSIQSKNSGINLIDIGYIGFIIEGNYIIKLDNIGIKLPNGDINNPSISYINDKESGFYYESGSSINLSYKKNDRIKIFSDKILISDKLQFNNSSIQFIKTTPAGSTQYLMESYFKLNGNTVIGIYDNNIELTTKSVNIFVDTIYFYNINKSSSFTNVNSNFNIDNQNGSVVFRAKGDIKLISNYNTKIYNYKISNSSTNLVSVGLTYSDSSSINTLILNSNGQIISSSPKISFYANSEKTTLANIDVKSSVSDTLTLKSLNINKTHKINKILIDRISYTWTRINKTSPGLPFIVNSFSSSMFGQPKSSGGTTEIIFDSKSYATGVCRTLIFVLRPVDTSIDLDKYEIFAQGSNSTVYYNNNVIYNYITDIECQRVSYSNGTNYDNSIRVVVNYFSNYYPNINDSMYENATFNSQTTIDLAKLKVTPGITQTSFDLLLMERSSWDHLE